MAASRQKCHKYVLAGLQGLRSALIVHLQGLPPKPMLCKCADHRVVGDNITLCHSVKNNARIIKAATLGKHVNKCVPDSQIGLISPFASVPVSIVQLLQTPRVCTRIQQAQVSSCIRKHAFSLHLQKELIRFMLTTNACVASNHRVPCDYIPRFQSLEN